MIGNKTDGRAIDRIRKIINNDGYGDEFLNFEHERKGKKKGLNKND